MYKLKANSNKNQISVYGHVAYKIRLIKGNRYLKYSLNNYKIAQRWEK